MLVIYTPNHARHDPPFELYDGRTAPYAETAGRAEAIVARLRQDSSFRIHPPKHYPVKHIQQVHHEAYVRSLRSRSRQLTGDEVLYPSYFITDTYAPVTPHTYRAAIGAVDTALTGAEAILHGENTVYALCRPPGHHAEHTSMGGYCYFNNAAVAANYLSRRGRVAILDIDFHHGNGTQHAFYGRSDVLYVSIHADPTVRYPYISGFKNERGRGEGLGFTKNYPLPLGTTNNEYLRHLQKTLRDINNFSPDYLVVSAGFDTYKSDPIGGFGLTASCYQQIGREIAAANLPTLLLQEGGYNVEALGELAHNFLKAFKS